MTRRRYRFDTETLGIKQRRKRRKDFDFTAVTAAAVRTCANVCRTLNIFSVRRLRTGDGFIHRHRYRNAVGVTRANKLLIS